MAVLEHRHDIGADVGTILEALAGRGLRSVTTSELLAAS
jgi:hypothetical protein